MPPGHYVWHNSGESSHLAPKTLQKLRVWRLPPRTQRYKGKPTVSSKPGGHLPLVNPILRSHRTHTGKENGLSNPDSEEPLRRRPASQEWTPSPSPSETSYCKHFFYKISDFSESNKYFPCPITRSRNGREKKRRPFAVILDDRICHSDVGFAFIFPLQS